MFDICNPIQSIFVTSKADIDIFGRKTSRDNITAIDMHMPVSLNPMLYAISLHKGSFTLELIRESKVFCINFSGKELKDAMHLCKENNGKHMDKFKSSQLEKEDANTIDCPVIKKHKGLFECRLEDEIKTGDHVIVIGKIMYMQKEYDAPRLFNSKIY